MKLVRYGEAGKEKPGLIDADGKLRSLSSVIKDITPEQLGDEALAKLRDLDTAKLPRVKGSPRIGSPVNGVGKFIAIGLNYADHAAESNMAIPEHPIVFYKSTTCIMGPNDTVMIPKDSKETDWEVELGVVIGRTARHVAEKDALRHVAGYCLINDLSEREFQLRRGGAQWSKGKGCDTFGPLGPWLVTTDELRNPQDLGMWLDVNGVRKQTGNTRTMIFGVARLIADLSRYMTLLPGDVITTGTPPGVGMGMKPQPQYLQPGDVVTLGIDGLGVQQQKVVAYKPRR